MARQKLKRFADNAIRENLIEPGKALYSTIKGQWHPTYFLNDNPITLELGCGQGEYTVGLAQKFLNRNFIGVDVKGNRIWNGSTFAIENNLKNVAFLRAKIQNLHEQFGPNEVSEIWITFPDPRPKKRDERRRLTNFRFLEMYKSILSSGGMIHLKTDSREFTDYTLDVIKELKIDPVQLSFDLYHEPDHIQVHHDIKTKYEKVYLSENKPINYLSFRLN